MARIAGVDLPRNKNAHIALTYIYGIGNSRSVRILGEAKVDPMKKIQDHNLSGRINWAKFLQAVEEQSGAPVDISRATASTAQILPAAR